MKQSCLVLLLLAAGALSVRQAKAQVSAAVYGEGTYTYLQNDQKSENTAGGTAGVMLIAPDYKKLEPAVDLQGRFVRGKNGASMNGVTIGPRLTAKTPFLSPYLELQVGFARYKDNSNIPSTDYLIGAEAGFVRKLTPRFDVTANFSYSRFGYNINFYDPYTTSVGVVYRFTKR